MISSLYLHIPFCESKCAYCSFSSFAGMEGLHNSYVDALEREIHVLSQKFGSASRLATVFLGGGTPSVLSAEQLCRLLKRCCSSFDVESDCEISIEANPGSVDYEKLHRLRGAGFNRLSIGVQSFAAGDLQVLGRLHSPRQAMEAVEAARSASFENISLDLMYGIPGQDEAAWRKNIDAALELNPSHLSLYQLTLEENTPMMKMYEAGEFRIVEEEQILLMDEYNRSAVIQSGLSMYEISNYARAGAECLHNCNYWLNNEYLAAGAGAVSYVGGKRERRVADPVQYIRELSGGRSAVVEAEQLSPEETFRETVIMGLRMSEGVSVERLYQRFGIELSGYYGPILKKLQEQSLVELAAGRLRVTGKGRLFSNVVMAELV